MKRIGMVTILLGCSTSLLATGQALAQPAGAPEPVGSTEQAAQAANSVIQADPAPREGSLQDIVVTATRQAQNLSKVPISVAAYSQEVLDQQGVRAVDDIARLTPGVTFTRGDYRNGGAANIAIRGISSTAGSATTGIYVDDTPIQIRAVGFSAFTPFPAVFDLERVEVLRGPQGTLFGAGSEGGTVRFITPRPDLDDVRAYGRTELATTESGDASYEAGAALSVPIVTDKIAVRGSGYYRHDGGWIDRVNYLTGGVEEENANSSDTIVLQGAIAFAPTETLTITPSVFYQKLEIDDGNFYWESLSDPGDGVFRNGNPIANTSKDRFVLPALKVEFEAGPVTIVSNTSYFDRKQSAVNDYSTFEAVLWAGTPFFPAGFEAQALQFNSQKNFTQEIRFQNTDTDSRLNWVIGGFYSRSRQRASQFVEDTFLPALILQNRGVTFERFFGQPLVQGRYTFVLDEANALDKQLAGFGQVDFAVTEKLKLTAGVRVAETRFNIAAQFVGPVVGPPVNDVGRQKESPVTPKFGISYQANIDNLFYTSAAKGFRSGGYNPAVGLPCGVSAAAPIPGTPLGNIGLANRPTQFGSDSVWSYEVGSKNKLFDRRLQLDASAFRIDWKNIQQSIGLACGFNFTDNLGSARSQGFEIAFQAAVTDAFTLGGSVGYTKAEFKDTVRAGPTAPRNIVSDGDDIVLNPWQVYLNGQYNYDLIGRRGYMRFDYQYQSGQDATVSSRNPLNGSADLTIPGRQGFHTLALRSGVTFEGIDVSLFVNNLFDSSKQILRQHDIPPSPLYRGTTLRPRTIGLTASYRM